MFYIPHGGPYLYPSTWEMRAGGTQVQAQSELQSETLSPENKKQQARILYFIVIREL
jgi:hypothetical protein